MSVVLKAVRFCWPTVAAAVLFSGLTAPAQAGDTWPIISDIPMPRLVMPDISMPRVYVPDIRIRWREYGEPAIEQPQIVTPRGPLAALAPPRFDIPIEGPIPPVEVARMLRSSGYSLLGRVERHGRVYTVAVLNPRGDDGRAIIDARTGAIIRFIPALAVNRRLNNELDVIYGLPGPPRAGQDFRAAPRSPAPLPRVTKRDAAPKLADRMPSAAQPVTTSSIPAKSDSSKPEPAKPAAPTQQAASAQTNQPEAAAEVKPAPAPQLDVKPSTPELLPTQPMPGVQTLD